MTREEEREILKVYAEDPARAYDRIVTSHLRFVIFIINNYKIPRTVDAMDVVQEGNMGLMVSIPKFDATRYDCRIATYSQFWIRFYVNKALSLKERDGSHVAYMDELSTVPDEYIDDNLEFDKATADGAREDIALNLIKKLPPREFKVVSLLLGIEAPFKPKTLKEVGTMLHIHAERVRGIKNTALERLKTDSDVTSLYNT